MNFLKFYKNSKWPFSCITAYLDKAESSLKDKKLGKKILKFLSLNLSFPKRDDCGAATLKTESNPREPNSIGVPSSVLQ